MKILKAGRRANAPRPDTDFLGFVAGAVGFGFVIFGYSYSTAFFRSFGLALSEVDFEWLDIVYRGVALLADMWVLLSVLSLGFILVLLWNTRHYFEELGNLLVSFLSLTAVIAAALFGGQHKGATHARAIWGGFAGKPIWCRFSASGLHELDPGFVESFYALARAQRLRLIHINEDMVYIAPTLERLPQGQTEGEIRAIPKAFIGYCRIVGG